jgi:hypothetical protein
VCMTKLQLSMGYSILRQWVRLVLVNNKGTNVDVDTMVKVGFRYQ